MLDFGLNLDPNLIMVLGGGGAAMVLILIIGLTAVIMMRPRARLKNRMVAMGLGATAASGSQTGRSTGTAGRQRRVQERLKEIEAQGNKRGGKRTKYSVLLLRAGVDMKVRTFMIISAGVGLVAAIVYLLIGYPPLGALPVAVVAAIVLPRKVITTMATRRQKEFTKYFANALDIVVRGIKSGLPVGECLAIIGRESPDPVGEEFRMMVEGQRIGLDLEEIMRRGLERIPTPEYKFFAIVLQIQQQTGGNLAETLENLARVLRERKKLRDKIVALSSEAKASAMIIGSLPVFVTGAVQVMTPHYLEPLFTEPGGQKMLMFAVFWMAMGVGVMYKMINFEI